MKKLLYITLCLVILSLVPAMAAEPLLTADISQYEPIPAQPGQYVTIYVELENNGNDDAENVAIEIVNRFPYSVVSDSVEEIGNLKALGSYVADFRLRIDSEAVVGYNNIKIKYTTDKDRNIWQETEKPILIKPNQASLSITDVVLEPEELEPGQEGTVTLTLKNTANIFLRNIAAQITMQSTLGTTVTDLPFIPVTATEQRITKLNPGEYSEITYTLKAYPGATPGYYKLPLETTFYDEQGTQTTQEDVVGVVVKAKPELKIYLEDTTLTQKDSQGKITLKFVNKGVNDMKFLDIEILNDEDYKVLSGNMEYIGDLDSDDYRSEEFVIIPKEDNTNLQIQYSFKDENNKEYSGLAEITLTYDLLRNGQKGGMSTTTVVILLLIVGGITYLIYKRRSKRRKHKHH